MYPLKYFTYIPIMFSQLSAFSLANDFGAINPVIQARIENIASENNNDRIRQEADALSNDMANHKVELCQQFLLYISSKHEYLSQETGWNIIVLYNHMKFSPAEKTAAFVPLMSKGLLTLDGPDNEHLGRSILREIEMPYGLKGDIDFSPYEKYMTRENNKPAWLIAHMYETDPLRAIISFAKIDLTLEEAAEFAQKVKATPIDFTTLQELGGRPEWWAHLYVATMLEKDSFLRTPELLEKLEEDTHPLVREKVIKIKGAALPEENAASDE